MSVNWHVIRTLFLTYSMLTIGAFVGAVGVLLFLAPFNIAPSGVAGIAVILNRTIQTPIGLVVFILNIPIQFLAYRMLPGGWRNVMRTLYTILIYTMSLDYFGQYIPAHGISDEMLLNAIFGGVVGGIGGGIVIRAGGNFGGTSTLAIIIQRRTGLPLSSIYLYTDTAVIVAAGLLLGWESALFATLALFIDGVAANYVMEGPSVIRTALIVTDHPQEVSQAIIAGMHRGVTAWEATGMYTGNTRHVLYVSIARSQVQDLRRIVAHVDVDAFLIIGHGHAAYGEGFHRRTAPLISHE